MIPKIIHKIYINEHVSFDNLINDEKGKNILEAIETFKDKNKDYEIKIYDYNKCLEYLEKYYGKEELDLFNILRPYAYKCDLMRYLILKREGGFYTDIKNLCLESFDKIFDKYPNLEWISCIENCQIKRMANGFIGCIPNHRYLNNVLEKIKINIKNRYYGDFSTDITGPGLLYHCCDINEDHTPNDPNIKYGSFDFDKNMFYFEDREIILWKFLKNNKEKFVQGEEYINGENNYNKLWKRKKVYNW